MYNHGCDRLCHLAIHTHALEAELPLGWEAHVVPQGQEFAGMTYYHYEVLNDRLAD